MELWSIGILIIGISIAVAVLFLIPSLIQLTKTLKSAERFMDDMDTSVKSLIYDEVKPLVRSVNNTMDEVEILARTAREGVEKVDEALESVRELGHTVSTVNAVIDTSIKGTLLDIGAYMVGFKAAIGSILQNITSKKREVA